MDVMLHVRAVLTGVLLCTLGQVGQSQTPGPGLDPTATVQKFWNAVLAMRWVEAVRYLDLGDVERARRIQLDMARASRGRDYTVVDLMRRDPDMPREAAEYEVRRSEKMRQQYPDRPYRGYFGIDSATQLERMPLEEVAVRWLQAHDPLWLIQEQRRTFHCPPAPWADSLALTRRAVVHGVVFAGSDTAFVLFRPAWFPLPELPDDALEFRGPTVAILRRINSEWRIRALEDLVQGSGTMFGMNDCPAR